MKGGGRGLEEQRLPLLAVRVAEKRWEDVRRWEEAVGGKWGSTAPCWSGEKTSRRRWGELRGGEEEMRGAELRRDGKREVKGGEVTHRSTTVFTVSHCCFRHTTVLHRDNIAACCCSTSLDQHCAHAHARTH